MNSSNFFEELDELNDRFLIEALNEKRKRQKVRSVIKTTGFTLLAVAVAIICISAGGLLLGGGLNGGSKMVGESAQPVVNDLTEEKESSLTGEFVSSIVQEFDLGDGIICRSVGYEKYKSDNVRVSETLLEKFNGNKEDEAVYIVVVSPVLKDDGLLLGNSDDDFYEKFKRDNDVNVRRSGIKGSIITLFGNGDRKERDYYPIIAELTETQLGNLIIDDDYMVYINIATREQRIDFIENN